MCRTRTARAITGGFFLAGWLAACAPLQTDRVLATAHVFPDPVELTEVPFFPQQEYQCGPAALATVLNAAGVLIDAESLTPQVYLPARRGSLQVELLATARRYGRVPYVLRPQLEAVLAEVASGHAVLVLQNLGLSWSPRWHYAVVVGFDLPNNEVVLRSGLERRHRVSLQLFERTWRRGGYWAIVVLPPERLPDTAEELPYLQSVVALERLQRREETTAAYRAALKRWPKSLGAWMGLGNSRYALGDRAGAAQAFRQASHHHPASADAHNNLAHVLAELGRLREARTAAERAVELGGPGLETYRRTLAEITARESAPAPER